ncbi:MAG: PSD1 domain-containing protein [Verrucomicrobiae bacterium]|nr:PSD1 domain-containing protein [Verrucomicrobiae bacterium]
MSLAWRGGWATGGKRGAALIPGAPDRSLLIQAVEGTLPNLVMPHRRERLSEAETGALREWVRMGAYDPRKSEFGAQGSSLDVRKVAEHWAFQPLLRPVPPPGGMSERTQTPVDVFVMDALKRAGIEASRPADRRTLIRRLYADLIGMPPELEAVTHFVADPSAGAEDRLIDRLLADPRYGERWGRHWLDVARYADTAGYRAVGQQRRFPYSYTYRDYVLEAFNRDLPFDRFVREQLAADLLLQDGASRESLAALGFLTIGRSFLDDPVLQIDDRIDVTTRGFLGLSVQCARCHDHKYDPIPTEDYYSLYGVFGSVRESTPLLVTDSVSQEQREAYSLEKTRRQREYDERFAVEVELAQHRIREVAADYFLGIYESSGRKADPRFLRERKLNPVIFGQVITHLGAIDTNSHSILGPWFGRISGNPMEARNSLNNEIAKAVDGYMDLSPRELASRYNEVFSKCDRPEPFGDPAREAVRQFLRAPGSPFTAPESEHWNLVQLVREPLNELKSAIAELDAIHPGAPARAMALEERVPPVDPAVFVRGNPRNRGNPVPRRMLAMLSGKDRMVYGESSGRLEVAESIVDRANPLTARVFVNRVWLHHFGRPLVDSPNDFGVRAEEPSHPKLLDWLAIEFIESGWSVKHLHRLILRSATYGQVSENRAEAVAVDPENRLLWRMNRRRLDLEAMRDSLLAAAGRLDLRQGGKAVDILAEPHSPRRSVYAFIDRADVSSFHRAFDLANPDVSVGTRTTTSVPQQALFLMNSHFMDWLAEGLVNAPEFSALETADERLNYLWSRIFQRFPSATEREEATAFLREQNETASYHGPVGWLYGVGRFDKSAARVSDFKTFTTRVGNLRRFEDARFGSTGLHDRGGHTAPPIEGAVIRRWIAPASGTIRLLGQLSHQSDFGDGLAGYAVSSKQGLLGEWPVKNGAMQTVFAAVPVETGEVIDFVCDCGESDSGDEFVWIPRIEYTSVNRSSGGGGIKMVWGAKADFDRRFDPIPRRMTRWEQYAQVLLQANELHFID